MFVSVARRCEEEEEDAQKRGGETNKEEVDQWHRGSGVRVGPIVASGFGGIGKTLKKTKRKKYDFDAS